MSTPQEMDETARAERLAKRLRLGAIVLGVALLAAFAIAIFMEVKDSANHETWAQYASLVDGYEGEQDFVYHDRWVGTDEIYSAPRARFAKTLQTFLEKKAGDMDATLEPHVRWRLAKTLTDHILASPDVLEYGKREGDYETAIAQLETIRDDFGDFPLNWSRLQTGDQPTLTRSFLNFLKTNQAWEKEHLPSAHEPTGAHTILVRTNRGDLRMRLYETRAATWTQGFIDRAVSGAYDGTALFQKKDLGTPKEPEQHFVRGAAGAFRAPEAYDRDQHAELHQAQKPARGIVPDASRSEVLHVRGVVSAWHSRGQEYDDPQQLLFVQRRSPRLDYDYTPIGKLMDEASLATLDRIFDTPTWDDDTDTRDDRDGRFTEILDYFQAPAIIQKVLVYDASGQLLEPAEGAAVEGRSSPSDGEKRLSSVKADAYKAPVPERSVAEDDDAAPADGSDDDLGGDDLGGDDLGGDDDE